MPDQLSDIRQLVLDRYAASASDPLFDPSVIDRMINVSNKRLGRVKDWPWLIDRTTISLLNGVQTYDLLTIPNLRHIKYLAVNNDKLTYKFPQAFVASNTLTGVRPALYTIEGNNLLVSPIPTEAGTLDVVYVLDEGDLLSDSDTPLLPSAYTELLVLATLPALAMRKKDTEYYNLAKQEYKVALQEAMDEVQRTRQNPSIDADDAMWTTL